MPKSVCLFDQYTGEKANNTTLLVVNDGTDVVEMTLDDIDSKLNFLQRERDTLDGMLKTWLALQKMANTTIQKS